MKLLPWVLVAAACASALDVSSRPLRRYLVATASNDGGSGKIPLRFSGDDARGVVSTMRSVGGVAPGEVELVLEPDTGRFLSVLREVSHRMALARDSGYRVELLLYYSGHSDEEGLLLGSTRLRYRDLRKVLEQSPADVRLAVLDACASGAALRTKGGVRRQAFQVDGSDRLRGQAYLTSSRAEEASQESDKLGGSVFTHAFLAGVRGAADADGDGRVTLLEAYRYAYRETVEKTSSTRIGPQHPEFDLDLSGSGDVVLSDIAQAGAVLELAGGLRGRVRVSDSSGAVAADLDFASGRNLPLGLPAGTWRVTMTDSVQARTGSVVLAPGSRQVVGMDGLDSVVAKIAVVAITPDTTSKPDTVRFAAPASAKTDSVPTLHVPLDLGFAPPATINSVFRGRRIKNNIALDVFAGEEVDIEGFQVTGGIARALEIKGFQTAGLAAWSKGPLDGFQSAGLAGFGDGPIRGFQTAGLVAWNRGTLQGFQSAGLVSRNAGRLDGFQSAGLWTSLAGGLRGFQTAGLAAWSKGPVDGFQSAGLASIGDGPIRGFQTAGLAAWNRGTFQGFQTAGLVSRNVGPLDGFQTAGLASSNEGAVRGVQAAGLFVYGAHAVQGVQAAGVSAWSDDEVQGLQTAGVFAYAGSNRGLQVSVVNVSGGLTGAQVGVVNVAGHVSGTQIGVVNLAGKSEGIVIGVVNLAREFGAFPVGIVNLGADMKPGLDVALDEAGWGSLALRFEGERFHSRMGGTARLDDPRRRLGGLFGFGAHWDLDKNWRIDADLAARNVFQERDPGDWREANWNSVSVAAARKLGPVRLAGGLSYNVLVSDRRGEAEGFVGTSLENDASNDYVKLWPGAFVSLSL